MFSKLSTIPLVLSSLALLVVLGMMISPVGVNSGGEKVYALDSDSSSNEQVNEPVPYTVPPDDGVSLTINTSLPENETIEKEVSGSGAKYITVDFTVGAHNVDDYKVYVQADSTTLTGNTYKDQINTINSPTTAEGMNSATKKWGYAVVEGANADTSTMTFNTIQTGVSIPAKTVTGIDGGKIVNHTQPYTLAFAANLDGAKADHYRSDITLSVAAGAEEVSNIGFAGKTYMQDVDKTFCDSASIPIGTEGRLIDKRDGKVYWVTKLKDGLCWMTQNLSLDLTEGETLTNELTDLDDVTDQKWQVPDGGTTLPSGTKLNSGVWPSNNDIVKSYNPGAFVYTTPTKSNACSSNDGLAGCTEKGWVEVNVAKGTGAISSADPTWTATFNAGFINAVQYLATDGQTICNKIAGDIFGDMTSEYIPCRIYYYSFTDSNNAHYLSGNYYSWNAAVAETGGRSGEADALGSICPKGWKLPTSGYNNTSVGSFGGLTKAFGFNGNDTGSKMIRGVPLYFLYGGNVQSGGLYSAGSNGAYWPATANSDPYTYVLYFDDNTLNPYYHNTNFRRFYGRSVRCVAR